MVHNNPLSSKVTKQKDRIYIYIIIYIYGSRLMQEINNIFQKQKNI